MSVSGLTKADIRGTSLEASPPVVEMIQASKMELDSCATNSRIIFSLHDY
jgi:hypothetical protein